MLRIGLTGGIGSGKTAVARLFSLLGTPVFYADAEAKKLMETDQHLVGAIKEVFGNDMYHSGRLDRKALAAIVFTNAYKLEQLNALVHPVAIAAAKAWMSHQQTAYVIKEAALLFESGSADNLDYVIGVTAPKALRTKRVMERDTVTAAQVQSRMINQIDDSIKMKLCDFVVINDEQQPLIPQVLSLHQRFIEMHS